MKPSSILVFGNPRVRQDSIPLKILPRLKKQFPEIKFKVMDPAEIINQDEEDLWILDTVQGIDHVRIINDPSIFQKQSALSVHDYDLAFDIKLLLKIKKVKRIKIIAIPKEMTKIEAAAKVTELLASSGL